MFTPVGYLIANAVLILMALHSLGYVISSIEKTDWVIYEWRLGKQYLSTMVSRVIVTGTTILGLLCLLALIVALNVGK